jgi:hypothetical protein
MTEPLGERLEELEKAVSRAELQRLRQERKETLSQVNAMLKEMEKLDL